jgi:hypothetical protein
MNKYIFDVMKNNPVPYLRTIWLDRFKILILSIISLYLISVYEINKYIWYGIGIISAIDIVRTIWYLYKRRNELSREKYLLELSITIADQLFVVVATLFIYILFFK